MQALATAPPEISIDSLIEVGLRKTDLQPSPPAEPHHLLRRLHYVTTGLPPTPDEVDAFAKAAVQDVDSAISNALDSLLACPHFGERWARHWLDLARYADVAGNDTPRVMPEAWRYRDYVIAAFNQDKPFPEFVREQVAGDLLPYDSPEEHAEHLVATSFLCIGHVIKIDRDRERQKLDIMDEQMDVLGRTFL